MGSGVRGGCPVVRRDRIVSSRPGSNCAHHRDAEGAGQISSRLEAASGMGCARGVRVGAAALRDKSHFAEHCVGSVLVDLAAQLVFAELHSLLRRARMVPARVVSTDAGNRARGDDVRAGAVVRGAPVEGPDSALLRRAFRLLHVLPRGACAIEAASRASHLVLPDDFAGRGDRRGVRVVACAADFLRILRTRSCRWDCAQFWCWWCTTGTRRADSSAEGGTRDW